nr:MAG TPA: hypothetical protein [Caudoviricetes sp.]
MRIFKGRLKPDIRVLGGLLHLDWEVKSCRPSF